MSDAVRLLENIKKRMQTKGLSDSAMSLAIGRNRGWLNGLILRQAAPNACDCRQIAALLECSIDDLFEDEPEMRSERTPGDLLRERVDSLCHARGYRRPEVHELIAWFISNGGALENHHHLAAYLELYGPPDEAGLRVSPISIGRSSLFAIEFGLQRAEELCRIFEMADADVRRDLVSAHRRVLEAGQPDTRTCKLEFRFAAGLRVTIEYIRVLLPVRDLARRPVVLGYCCPMRRVETSTRDILSFGGLDEARMTICAPDA